jgi:hypothetical protein
VRHSRTVQRRRPAEGQRIMGKRPDHVTPPDYLTPNTPVPEPEPIERPDHDPLGHDPVRFGDWELKGIAVDF